MKALTNDQLNTLLNRYKAGSIHEILTELQSIQAKADAATDEAEKGIFLENARDMTSVLQMELRKADIGEDFVNDGEFNTK